MLKADSSLIHFVEVGPSVLVDEEGTGCDIYTEPPAKLATSYADLGVGMVEIALGDKYDQWEQIGVGSKGGDRVARYLPTILGRVSTAFFVLFFPGGAPIAKALGMC